MDVSKPILGTRLKELRGGRSIHLVEQESGIYNISRYEKGVYQPKEDVLRMLAEYYQSDFRTLYKLQLEDLYPPESLKREILLEWLEDQR